MISGIAVSPQRCHTFLVFSETVLDHFRSPRNAGELPNADAHVEVANPVCGDILQLAVRLNNNSEIAEARFLCRGCTASIAAASLLTEEMRGHSVSEISAITAESISQSLGNLPATTFHAAQLAADAVSAVLQKLNARR
ncbi:MAG TPA: iron-sulfur cluster assembly scaffold protein [Candidatus Acidoferrum sp.]